MLEGTGSRIYFQTGNNSKHLREVPLYRNVAAGNYTSTNCVNTMGKSKFVVRRPQPIFFKKNLFAGHHNYYNVPKMMHSNCTKIIPSFLLFNNMGELHGFGQTTVGKLLSPSLEHPDGFAVKVKFE